jgi:3-hydroxyacyl-CoA dehydrogenase
VGLYFDGDRAEVHCSAYTSPKALEVAKQLASRMAKSYVVTSDGQAK